MIGRLGTFLGNASVNIASFALGRTAPGSDAIALLEVDSGVDDATLAALRKLPHVKQASALTF
jgi:D-3-phosphoglycerate dehydrogenase